MGFGFERQHRQRKPLRKTVGEKELGEEEKKEGLFRERKEGKGKEEGGEKQQTTIKTEVTTAIATSF